MKDIFSLFWKKLPAAEKVEQTADSHNSGPLSNKGQWPGSELFAQKKQQVLSVKCLHCLFYFKYKFYNKNSFDVRKPQGRIPIAMEKNIKERSNTLCIMKTVSAEIVGPTPNQQLPMSGQHCLVQTWVMATGLNLGLKELPRE